MGDRGFRAFERPPDFRQCVELQHRVWGLTHPRLITEELLGVCLRFGATLLGAFEGDGRLLGFVFGFPSFWKGRPAEHSHMLAVRPSCRDRGIGTTLKRMQFERAKARGLDCVTWTFDPLVARNAHLNLNRLGAKVEHYYVDLYGEGLGSPLHSGIGTDRFLVRRGLDRRDGPESDPLGESSRVRYSDSLPQALCSLRNEDGRRLPVEVEEGLESARLLVEIPFDVHRIREADPEAARRWREATRRALRGYMGRGFRVRRLISVPGEEDPRAFYLLERDSPRRESRP